MAQQSIAREAEIVGFLEMLSNGKAYGWAWDPSQPDEPVEVEIYDGESLLGTVRADLPRHDLAAQGIGDGRHAFQLELPARASGNPANLRAIARSGASGQWVSLRGAERLTAANANGADLAKLVRQLEAVVEKVESSQKRLFRNAQGLLGAIEQRVGPGKGSEAFDPFLAQLHTRLGELTEEVKKLRRRPRRVLLVTGVWIVALLLALQIAIGAGLLPADLSTLWQIPASDSL